jgi:hypothetical protein
VDEDISPETKKRKLNYPTSAQFCDITFITPKNNNTSQNLEMMLHIKFMDIIQFKFIIQWDQIPTYVENECEDSLICTANGDTLLFYPIPQTNEQKEAGMNFLNSMMTKFKQIYWYRTKYIEEASREESEQEEESAKLSDTDSDHVHTEICSWKGMSNKSYRMMAWHDLDNFIVALQMEDDCVIVMGAKYDGLWIQTTSLNLHYRTKVEDIMYTGTDPEEYAKVIEAVFNSVFNYDESK